MNVKIHEPTQIVEVMLTHAEQADEEVKKQLKELYAQYKGTKYTVAVFLSGKRDLYEDTRDLLLFNRRLLAEGHNISENALRGFIRQGILPAVKIGRKSLLYYPNVIKLLTEGNNHVSSDDERPSYIPAKISV